ncbi:MAG: protein kinase [Symploca sp. SIO2E6]|nr:protein kinase [Symploca sp. SIO2E6]
MSDCEPEQFKQIASSLLETLVYLQNFDPATIHRNIKPENILIDEQLQVYLVDFGLPYMDSSGKPKNSLAGTPGFMPREQVRNRGLSEATDLYGVGATLSCLLTRTPSNQINQLMAQDGHLNIAGLIPQEVSFELVEWLETMMKPYQKQRYPNATEALEALKQIDISRSPEAKLKPDYLEFTAASYGERLTQIVTVTNEVPGTLLQGTWKVNPETQPSRRRSASSRWISCQPAKFETNRAECKIIVDTSKLMADEEYEREITLDTNAQPQTHRKRREAHSFRDGRDSRPPLCCLLFVFCFS